MLVKQSCKVFYLLSTRWRWKEAQNFHPGRQGARLVRGREVLAEKLQELGIVERQSKKRIKEGGKKMKTKGYQARR